MHDPVSDGGVGDRRVSLLIRPATIADAVAILPHLRQADRDEVYWQSGLPPELVVPMSVHPGSLCAEVDGAPVALFGCIERSPLTGSAAPRRGWNSSRECSLRAGA